MKHTGLYINGEWVDSLDGGRIDSIDPTTGEVWLSVAEAREADVDRAVDAAYEAFERGPWRHMTASQRGELMRRLADLVMQNAERLAHLETKDNGIHIRDTRNYATGLANWLYYYAGLADKIEGATIPVRPTVHAYTRREPVGVVGAITPWNAPLLMYAFKLGPALAAGNTVVLKPAEQTPATALALAELIEQAGFPPGVVNVVPGYGETAGARLVANPKVNKIAFTGEHLTGRIIMKNAADTLKRVTFELGGKAPHIVFDDADLDRALPVVVNASFLAAGQSCSLGSRVFVHERIYDQFMERYLERASRVRIGNPFDTSVQIGPQAFEDQVNKTMRYIDIGRSEGAKLVLGGRRPTEGPLSKGYFVEPTVFTDVEPNMRIAQEEIFGPVASIIRFKDEAQLIEQANNVIYGLSAGVWTQDVGRAHRIAAELKAGSVWVNTYRMLHYMLPYGGFKMSGIGRENGMEVIHHYTEVKTVVVDLSTEVNDPWA
ncbi:MAG: aldehyde dehydrogenase [Alicyclobacillus macrosporangiidus]|nr:aldehyde dehydrogenase [Alicyclobacillus macrosporangiidus]